MKHYTKLLSAALALFGASFTTSYAWKWSMNPITGFGYFAGEEEAEVSVEEAETQNSNKAEDIEEIDADLDADEDSDEPDFYDEEDIIVFDFDSLGIDLLPVGSDFLEGTASKQAEYIREFLAIDGGVQGAVSQFVSLYRSDASLAIKVLEKKLKMSERMLLIKNAPVAFVGKLLSDMGKNIDGIEGELYHWGSFVMKNENYGTKELDRALITASARPVHYLWAIILHGAQSDKEIKDNAQFIYQALQTLADDDVVNLLAYTPEEASAKIGKKQKEICFGRLKKEGLCSENSPQYLPVQFVAAILPGFNDYTIFTTLEKEEEHNSERAKEIIDLLDPKVYKRILLHMEGSMREKVSVKNVVASNPLMSKYQNDENNMGENLLGSGSEENTLKVLQAGPSDEYAEEHSEL